jgi:indolepyruvate ferredoxin oxidoreductase
MLQPPLARLLGMRRKKAFGPWFRPVLRGLASLKFLRGTPFDPFGRAHVRQQERALVAWYEGLVEAVLGQGPQVDAALALELLSLPETVRGYEEIKLKALVAARERAMVLLARLA